MKGMPPKKIHEDSMETFGRSLLLKAQWKKWTAEFKRGRMSVDGDGRSGRTKDATAYENVKVVHTVVMCDSRGDLRSIASKVLVQYNQSLKTS